MNQAIASILKGRIEDLDFVDKIAGLVATQYMTITDENGTKVTKSYPVACCVTADDCKQGDYNDLTPDSKYKSVIYFEDRGVSFNRYEGNFKHYTSSLRLVCWLNVRMILGEDCDASACTYSSHAITDIIRHLPQFPYNFAPFVRVYAEVTNQVVRSNGIFSAYTYNEKQTQYLMSPYDYFALDIQTTFAICLPGTSVYSSCDTTEDSMADCIDGLTDDSGDVILS
jgi:hypothetical protein